MRIAVTGEGWFLDRYRGLTDELAKRASAVDVVRSGNLMTLWRYRVINRLTRGTPFAGLLRRHLQSLDRRVLGYDLRTSQTEAQIKHLPHGPDIVLHIFGSFAPGTTGMAFPYALYLDYTMALAMREWPLWADFSSYAEGEAWLERERDSYSRAMIIFTMGERTASSLVEDYGVSRASVQVVGSGGDFSQIYTGTKTFGSRQILFYGSEFERKGGDIVIDAFKLIRARIPDARLVIIGNTRDIQETGIESVGYINDRSEVERYFLSSDIVLAPSRCDPFPGFVIEAMNYGVPCVVTRASGISDVLTHETNALIVDGLRPETIASEAVRLLLDPLALARLSANSRQLVADELNWAAVGNCIAGHLSSATEARQRSRNTHER
jgi:glycogen synthase